MSFKKGDYVKLKGYGDTVYRIIVDKHEHGLMCLSDENEITWEHPSIFELVHSDKPEPEDQPTLTDIDRIRLETAASLSKVYTTTGEWGQVDGAILDIEQGLKDADKLINLIMDNPFIRTK